VTRVPFLLVLFTVSGVYVEHLYQTFLTADDGLKKINNM